MIESPCIGICTLINNSCIGCTRTAEEISNWLFYKDSERKIITERCLKNMEGDETKEKIKSE